MARNRKGLRGTGLGEISDLAVRPFNLIEHSYFAVQDGVEYAEGRPTALHRVALRDLATWLVEESDKAIDSAGGSGGGGGTTFADNAFALFNVTDSTKRADWLLSGVSTGTTRTITMADQDIDLTPGSGSYLQAAASLFDLSDVPGTPNYTAGLVLRANGAGGYAASLLGHNDLAGLGGDDHTQYLLGIGTRPLVGDWDNTGRRIRNTGVAEVSAVEPVGPVDGVVWLDTGAGGSPGAPVLQVDTLTVSATLTDLQTVLLCDASVAPITLTLPVAAVSNGRRYFIKKIDGTGNAVTVDGDGAEVIDDASTQVILSRYDSMEIVCDGVGWSII